MFIWAMQWQEIFVNPHFCQVAFFASCLPLKYQKLYFYFTENGVDQSPWTEKTQRNATFLHADDELIELSGRSSAKRKGVQGPRGHQSREKHNLFLMTTVESQTPIFQAKQSRASPKSKTLGPGPKRWTKVRDYPSRKIRIKKLGKRATKLSEFVVDVYSGWCRIPLPSVALT